MPTSEVSRLRRQRLLANMQGRPIDEAILQHGIRADLEAEAAEPDIDALITPAALAFLHELIAEKQALEPTVPRDLIVPTLFLSTGAVVIVPGCLASSLSDTASHGLGLVWASPTAMLSSQLGVLQLGAYDGTETDLDPRVRIAPTGALPILYDLLRLALEVRTLYDRDLRSRLAQGPRYRSAAASNPASRPRH